MEYAKSVHHALRPKSLFAALVPVGISLSLLRISHAISLLRVDVAATIVFAVLVQLMANLNAVYSSFRRSLRPVTTAAATEDHHGHSHGQASQPKIVINLLSQTQVQRWSYLFFVLLLAVPLAVHFIEGKSTTATGGALLIAFSALVYCRRQSSTSLPPVKSRKAPPPSKLSLPWTIPGLEEAVVATAAGPLAIIGTHFYIVDYPLESPLSVLRLLPIPAVLYSIAVMNFTWAYLIVSSCKDAPFARMMPGPASSASIGLRLGLKHSFQLFLLLIVSSYALVSFFALMMGHLPNALLLVTMEKVKDISDAFREEQLHDLPDRVAKLGGFLGGALIISINVSASLILGK